MLIPYYDDQKIPKGTHRLPFICPLSLVLYAEDCTQGNKLSPHCKFFKRYKHEIFDVDGHAYHRSSVDCCANPRDLQLSINFE